MQTPDCVNDVARVVYNLAQAQASAELVNTSLTEAVTNLTQASKIIRYDDLKAASAWH